MIERALAVTVAVVCAVLLLRLCLGDRRRERIDAAAVRFVRRCRRAAASLWHWRSRRRRAARLAEDAIHRARGKVVRDGNVYKPKSFRRPRKPH